MNIEVTIGWTISDMANGYSSFSDGYRPGAKQHVETITADLPELTPHQIAEAVYSATNSPWVATNTAAGQILTALTATGYRGEGAHWSLSVGDTVTVSEVMLACGRMGWERVRLA